MSRTRKPRRVIVAGSRDYGNWIDFKMILDEYLLADRENIEIVSGEARGPDRMAIEWADLYGIHVEPFPADWDRYGRSAGHRRNAEMAAYGTELIVFWDGESRGTKGMITEARRRGLRVRIILVDTEEQMDSFEVLFARVETKWLKERQHESQKRSHGVSAEIRGKDSPRQQEPGDLEEAAGGDVR